MRSKEINQQEDAIEEAKAAVEAAQAQEAEKEGEAAAAPAGAEWFPMSEGRRMSLKLLPNKTYAKLPFGAKDAAEEEEKAELISGIPWLQPIVDSQTFLYATIGVLFGNMVVMCMPYQGKQQHQQQHTTTAAAHNSSSSARQQHSALTAHHSLPFLPSPLTTPSPLPSHRDE